MENIYFFIAFYFSIEERNKEGISITYELNFFVVNFLFSVLKNLES